MARLLVVHHTPSPSMDALLRSVLEGARTPEIEGVEVVSRAALAATVTDVLGADGYLLGTPANLGYMSGALKHFFDTIYYPCLEDTLGRPFGAYLHGGDDTTGARRALATITTGLRWTQVAEVVEVTGAPDADDRDALWELGATLAATLSPG
jgi:multimeric flavodoxin WrbA